jgi:hypothetical protein
VKISDIITEGTMKPISVSGQEKPGAVAKLKKVLVTAKKQNSELDYDSIDGMMQKICHEYNLTGDKLHDDFVKEVGSVPDDWIKMETESTNPKYLGPTDKVKINKKGWQIPLNKRGFGS